jgi:uncharacterized membrane protein YczE
MKKFLRAKSRRNGALLTGLGLTIVSTSVFLTVESGEFYSSLYDSAEWRGFVLAALVEVFLCITAAAWIKGRPGLSWALKFMMCILFVCTVGGASLKIVYPIAERIAENGKNRKLEKILSDSLQQSKQDAKVFRGQRVNQAITARDRRKNTERLIKAVKESNGDRTTIDLILIAISVIIRIAIQLINIFAAHLTGVMWRDIFETKKTSQKKIKKPIKNRRKNEKQAN